MGQGLQQLLVDNHAIHDCFGIGGRACTRTVGAAHTEAAEALTHETTAAAAAAHW